jgi:CheY-like chemotaxis protein
MKEKRIRILCVEDDTVDQMAVKRLVKTGGLPYDIVVAGTLSEASGLLEKNSYDLVLLDYTLPDGTGLELLKKIKETPSIFITGSGNEGVAGKSHAHLSIGAGAQAGGGANHQAKRRVGVCQLEVVGTL